MICISQKWSSKISLLLLNSIINEQINAAFELCGQMSTRHRIKWDKPEAKIVLCEALKLRKI